MPPAETANTLTKQGDGAKLFASFERTLGESLKPFMAEVYLVNAGTLASYVYSKREGNLGDILASSAEALCRPGLLRYARQSRVEFDWRSSVAITLRMEFTHELLTAVFDIVFDDRFVGIDIIGVSYRDELTCPEDGVERFARAVADLKRTDA